MARRSSGERVYLRHSPRCPSSRGLRQGERPAIDPPPDIYRVAVVWGEDAPPALPPQPSSRGLRQGERCRDRSPPDIYGVSVRLGEDAPLALLPPPTEPRPVAFVREGDVAGEPPPNIYGVAFVRERTRLWSSSRRTSSHGHLQRGGCRRQTSPKYLRHGCRPGGGCASGPPPVEPRRVAILQEGDAAGDPPPTFAVLRLSGGRMRLQHSPCRPSSRGLCPGGRRRGRSPPLMFAARRSSGGWVRLWFSSRQTYTANFREGVAAGDPPPNIYGVAVEGGRTRLRSPPNLVAWLSSERGHCEVGGEAARRRKLSRGGGIVK